MENAHIHPNMTKDLAAISHLVATQWLADLHTQDEEAGRLALELIASGLARLELRTVFSPGRAPAHRLLLEPADGVGEPVEVAVLGCPPVEPTPAGVEARFWFYGRMSHWQRKH